MFRLGSFPRPLTTHLKIFQKLKRRPHLILTILDKGHSTYKIGALGDGSCSLLFDSGYKEVWVPGLLALIQQAGETELWHGCTQIQETKVTLPIHARC